MTESTNTRIKVMMSAEPFSFDRFIVNSPFLLADQTRDVGRYRLISWHLAQAIKLPDVKNVSRGDVQQSLGFTLVLLRDRIQILRLDCQSNGHVSYKVLAVGLCHLIGKAWSVVRVWKKVVEQDF